jgi:predicted dinucleotide-binding enzyme
MNFKKLVSLNIAIVGDTSIAVSYANAFAAAGHEIYLADCSTEKRKHHPDPLLHEHIAYCTVADAAAFADMIIVATEPKDVREAAYWMGDVRRKVIVDVTANVHAPEEELVKTVCAIKAITGSPHVIKVFSTAGYEHLLKPLFGTGKVELLLLSDSKKAKEITKIMTFEIGVKHFYDFGNSENIPLFNEMTKSWRRLKLQEKATTTQLKDAQK